ncbi:MAG TPA: hypothetical protein VMH41_02555 [Mycobacteriales bacterium]|nr:hypothetical protein [Mycobacteriales bacterium]
MAPLKVAGLAVGLALALTGCSSGSSGADQPVAMQTVPVKPTPGVSRSATPERTVTATAAPAPAVTVTVTATSGRSHGSSSAAAVNLATTPAVEAQLVKAGAKSHGLPASDYTGLVPGETYYGYDPTTATYWAGAGLVPSPTSTPAQVSVQDDGSYLLFSRSASGTWHATNVGLAGVAGSTCPITPPPDVVKVWHWKKGACRPPS